MKSNCLKIRGYRLDENAKFITVKLFQQSFCILLNSIIMIILAINIYISLLLVYFKDIYTIFKIELYV
jgi:hypothetical protein